MHRGRERAHFHGALVAPLCRYIGNDFVAAELQMNKTISVEHPSIRSRAVNLLIAGFSESDSPEGADLTLCVACRAAGYASRAVGYTSHPEYRKLALCSACIAHYDKAVTE